MSTVQGGQGNIVTNGLILNLDAANPRSYAPPFNGTTWTDLSGNGNNGTLTNGPTFSSANGGSIVFDGTNDYVNLVPPNFNRNEITVCTVYNYSFSSQNYPLLLGNGTTTSDESFYISSLGPIYGTNRGKISAFFKAGNTTNQSTGRIDLVSSIITTGSYFYLTITYQTSSFANMYINGVLNVSASTTSNLLNPQTGSFNIGGGNPPNVGCDFYTGSISLVQIYNRALNASEVLQNFNATRARFGV